MKKNKLSLLMISILLIAFFANIAPLVGANNKQVEVLIGFSNHSKATQAVTNSGGIIVQTFTLIPAMHVIISETAVAALQKNPNIRYIEPNAEVYALSQTVPWGIDRVFDGATRRSYTWSYSTGEGVNVAVLDTGIASHEDLTIKGGVRFYTQGIFLRQDNNYHDDNGHGTHVAGTIAALNNNKGVVGVAPSANLYAVKVLNSQGSGTITAIINGIQWSIANGMNIISMSLGSSSYSQALEEACNTAYDDNGLLVVASAGNSGNSAGSGDNVGYPAKYASVIAVAATDSDDKRAGFSSTGPAVELAAPGVGVLSTVPGNSYASYSGTSMACPHVSGVAALVWAINPSLTNTEVRKILQDTAQNLGLPKEHQGYGLVRADLAVAEINPLDPPARGDIVGTVTAFGGGGIEGATVAIEGTQISATTKDDGVYRLEKVPVGEHQLVASANGYQKSQVVTVTVFEGGTVTQNFVLVAIHTYTISGRVTDSESTPLSGATVTVDDTDFIAITDPYGDYSIANVPEGTYIISASKIGYTEAKTQPIVLNSDIIGVNFALTEVQSSLSVVVNTDKPEYTRNSWVYITVNANSDSTPVVGASVSVTITDPSNGISNLGTVTTDANGNAQFRYRVQGNPPRGTYTVTADVSTATSSGTGSTTFNVK
jgi:subtilisin